MPPLPRRVPPPAIAGSAARTSATWACTSGSSCGAGGGSPLRERAQPGPVDGERDRPRHVDHHGARLPRPSPHLRGRGRNGTRIGPPPDQGVQRGEGQQRRTAVPADKGGERHLPAGGGSGGAARARGVGVCVAGVRRGQRPRAGSVRAGAAGARGPRVLGVRAGRLRAWPRVRPAESAAAPPPVRPARRFRVPARRVGGEERGETRIRFPVVPGDALAAGVQPSHGSDLTRCAGCARAARSGGPQRGSSAAAARADPARQRLASPRIRPGGPIAGADAVKGYFPRRMTRALRKLRAP